MAGATGSMGEFSIGRVIARGLDAVGADPAAVLLPALLFGAVPSVLAGWAADALVFDTAYALGEMRGELLVWGVLLVFGCVTHLTAQGAVTRAVLARRAGNGVTVWATMRPALRRLPALAVAGLVVGTLTFGTGLFLVVPGLLVFAAFSLASSAIVEEGCGTFAALRRSALLCRHAFGRVLALNLLLLVGYALFSTAVMIVGAALWLGTDNMLEGERSPLPVGLHLLSAFPVAVGSAAWAAIVATLYADLRDRTEGRPAAELARVFS